LSGTYFAETEKKFAGQSRMGAGMDRDWLAELAATDPGLSEALRQLRGEGLRDPTGPDPLLSAMVPADVLSEFLTLAVREVRDDVLFGLALTLPACIYKFGAGQEALDFLVAERPLPSDKMDWVRDRLSNLATTARDRLGEFGSPEVAAALLTPDRGPGAPGVLHGVALMAEHGPNPQPFRIRLVEWVHDGRFDFAGQADLGELFDILGQRRDVTALRAVRAALHARVLDLLEDPATSPDGVYYLERAVAVGYRCADELVGDLRRSSERVTGQLRARFGRAVDALGLQAH
jgi:hypothetical protein